LNSLCLELFTELNENFQVLDSKVYFIERFDDFIDIIRQLLDLAHPEFSLRLWLLGLGASFHLLLLLLKLHFLLVLTFGLLDFPKTFSLLLSFAQAVLFCSQVSFFFYLFVFLGF
jgi:hypothetical protein